MKNNFLDKKLTTLFVIMIIMAILMFYFLKISSKQREDIQLKKVSNIDVLETKRNTINKLLDDINKSFDDDLESFLNDLDSYINLPLKVEKVGNDYPFGNYVETKKENTN